MTYTTEDTYCQCGHAREHHVSPFSPGGKPGRCLHCSTCDMFTPRKVWVTDDREADDAS